MKKIAIILSSVALVVMGVATTSCDKLENDTPYHINPDGSVTYTVTVKMPEETKSLAPAMGNTLIKTFEEDERIKLTYGSITVISEKLKESDISNNQHSATFTFTFETLPELPKDTQILYEYPAAHTGLDGQDGTLLTLANKYDYAKWGGKVIDAGVLPTPGEPLANQYAICQFIFKNSGDTNISDTLTQLTISDGTNTYNIAPPPGETNFYNDIWVALQPFTDKTITFTATDGTHSYYKTTESPQTLLAGRFYPINVTMALVPSIPSGTIDGLFSVSSTKQVYFSQGNLQYTKSTSTWSFMEHQYSTVETTGSYCTSDYGNRDVVSLFGWATSGYNHGATCYQPYSTNTTNENYYAYGNASYNLYDQTGQADWGYNAISNGGNTENSGWRTLTTAEWQYLFANHTKGWSTVNGVNGYVIRPDGVSTAIAASYTASDWATEEAAGAVFLPAAGYRNSSVGTDVYDVGSIGRYWSSSIDSSTNAYNLYFSSSLLGPNYSMNRRYGESVRLVQDAN